MHDEATVWHVKCCRCLRLFMSVRAASPCFSDSSACAYTRHVQMADQLGWSYDGVKASLLLWAAGPGSQSLGAGTSSTSTRNSLFTEQVLKVSVRCSKNRSALQPSEKLWPRLVQTTYAPRVSARAPESLKIPVWYAAGSGRDMHGSRFDLA